MQFRAIQKFLLIALLAIFLVSTAAAMSAGASASISIFWSFMNIIGADFPPPFQSLLDPQNLVIFIAEFLDAQGKLIVTIILTTIFYELLSKTDINDHIIKRKVEKLSNHVIIASANGMAEEMARTLKKLDRPFVIVDPNKYVARRLVEEGMLVVKGDPSQTNALKDANIQKAAYLFLLEEDDVKNMLIAIEAKKLNSNIKVVARVKSQDDIARMNRAGISHLITPEIAVGDQLSLFLLKSVSNKA